MRAIMKEMADELMGDFHFTNTEVSICSGS